MAQSNSDALSDVPILIVGAGPVGLSAAILLARLGISSLVVERHSSTTDHPKARGFFTRTMEILRPWGVEPRIRADALPSGAFRFIWVESLAGREIGRVEPPRRDVPGPHSPTYVCMAAQDAFEAALRNHAVSYPQIDLRFNTELTAFVQDASGVAATLRQRDTGETLAARAAWLIAADGDSASPHWLKVGKRHFGHLRKGPSVCERDFAWLAVAGWRRAAPHYREAERKRCARRGVV